MTDTKHVPCKPAVVYRDALQELESWLHAAIRQRAEYDDRRVMHVIRFTSEQYHRDIAPMLARVKAVLHD